MTTSISKTATVHVPYVQATETTEQLDWADLVALDLSKFDKPGGKLELAEEFKKAIEQIGNVTIDASLIHHYSHESTLISHFSGFFYIINHGLSREAIDQQYALASSVLSLSDEDKAPYRAALEAGDFNGWKPPGTRELIPGVRDNFEIYNIPKFIPEHASRPHPDVVKENLATIERFSKYVNDEIVRKLLVIFALALDLEDEEWFVKKHRYERSSGDHLRYMKYYARSEEENRKLGGVWLKG